MSRGWEPRLYRVKAGLGSGPDAATIETVLEGQEWLGAFGSLTEDAQRQAFVRDTVVAMLAARFPGERITLVEVMPMAKRQRPSWDR